MSDLSPSERLYRLHELNRKEEIAQAGFIAGLAELTALALAGAALFVWIAILGTTP